MKAKFEKCLRHETERKASQTKWDQPQRDNRDRKKVADTLDEYKKKGNKYVKEEQSPPIPSIVWQTAQVMKQL
uniref:Uncharacterized protein n=1 Tax=Globodera rostochiensis TaxID=31243 RepID=A0A914HH85_GLORO